MVFRMVVFWKKKGYAIVVVDLRLDLLLCCSVRSKITLLAGKFDLDSVMGLV